jgi:hypothetical protein
MKTKAASTLYRINAGKSKYLDRILQGAGSETREVQFQLPTMGLRNDCLRGKGQHKLRKDQEGPTKT